MSDAIRVSADLTELRALVTQLGREAARVDLTPAMHEAAKYMQQTVGARIRRYHVDANGSGLQPLSRAYRQRKARKVGGLPILTYTGRFIRSLTSGREQILKVNAGGFEYGSSVPYAAWLMDGTKHMAARDVLSFSDNDLVKVEVILLEHVLKGLGAG